MIPRALFLLSCVSPFPVCLCPRFSGRRSACACLAPLLCLPVVPLSSRASLSLVSRASLPLVSRASLSLVSPASLSLVSCVSSVPSSLLCTNFLYFCCVASVLQGPRPPGPRPTVEDFSVFNNTRAIAVPPLPFSPHRFTRVGGVPPGGRFPTHWLTEAYSHHEVLVHPSDPSTPTPRNLTPVVAGGASSLITTIDWVIISRVEKRLFLPPLFSTPPGVRDEHLEYLNMKCADLCAQIGEEECDQYDTDFWSEERFYRPGEDAYETRNMRRIFATISPFSPLRAQLKQWATALDARQNGLFGTDSARFQRLYLDFPSKRGHPWAVGLNPHEDADRNVRRVPVILSLVFSLFFSSYGPQINVDDIAFTIERPFSLDSVTALFDYGGFKSFLAHVPLTDIVPFTPTGTMGTPRHSFLPDLGIKRPVQVFTAHIYLDQEKKLQVEVRVYLRHSSTHFPTHSPTKPSLGDDFYVGRSSPAGV